MTGAPLTHVAEPTRLEELRAAFDLIFEYAPPGERDLRVANAREMVQRGELDPDGILVVRDSEGIAGAMICLPVAGASGLVWPPRTRASASNKESVEDALVRAGVGWLRGRGAKLVQSLISQHEAHLAQPLLRCGFSHITSLWYMKHGLQRGRRPVPAGREVVLQTYAQADRAVFHDTLLRTYESSLDCPEVNGVRDIGEIIEGHRHQGFHDPRRWWLALESGTPIGVVLLTGMPENQTLELCYLGIVPDARRRGVGRTLTAKAIDEARASRATQLTLAVDARNRPAWALYRSLGFQPYEQREVYLAITPTA